MSKKKGLWIPEEILSDKSLSLSDKLVLSLIESFSEDCFAHNKYISELCGISIIAVQRSLRKLSELGYIEKKFNGSKRVIRGIKMIPSLYQNDTPTYIKLIHPYDKTIYKTNISFKENNNKYLSGTTTSYDLDEVEQMLYEKPLKYEKRNIKNG